MPQIQPLKTRESTVSNGVAPGGVSTRNNTTRPVRGGGSGVGGPRAGRCGTTRNTQREFQFTPGNESQQERCRRLLNGDIVRMVRPAAELLFDYEKATRVAEKSNQWQPVGTT